jgi:hypothetical protein
MSVGIVEIMILSSKEGTQTKVYRHVAEQERWG